MPAETTALTLGRAEVIMEHLQDALLSQKEKPIEGIPLIDIINALKIRIASEYNSWGEGEKFRSGLKVYGGIPMGLGLNFESFSMLKPKTVELKDEYKGMETLSSFADFCVRTGNAPDYWQKVYERAGMTWEEGLPYRKIEPEPNHKAAEKAGEVSAYSIAALFAVFLIALVAYILNRFHVSEFVMTLTTSLLTGTVIILFTMGYFWKIPLTWKDALWASAIGHGYGALAAFGLGFVLYNHLGIALVLMVGTGLFIQMMYYALLARTKNCYLFAGKQLTLALLVTGSDFLISSPIVHYITRHNV